MLDLEARWQAERALVDELLALRAKLRDGGKPVDGASAGSMDVNDNERAGLKEQLKGVGARLAALQGEQPLLLSLLAPSTLLYSQLRLGEAI